MVRATDRRTGRQEMVRLCQAALRRPSTCAALSRPLHPPHRHLQPSHDLLRRRERHLPLARLSPRQKAEPHDSRRCRVPAPLLPPCTAQRFRPHPPLRPALQPLPKTTPAPGTHPARRPGTPARAAPAATRLRSLALSPLRRTHASRRTLLRRTTLFRRPGLFMTVDANPLCLLASGTRLPACVSASDYASTPP